MKPFSHKDEIQIYQHLYRLWKHGFNEVSIHFCPYYITIQFFFNRIYILDETLQLFRLAVINVCPVLVPSELLLSIHLPTSEGWTAELTVGLWLVVPTTGFEPTRVDLV